MFKVAFSLLFTVDCCYRVCLAYGAGHSGQLASTGMPVSTVTPVMALTPSATTVSLKVLTSCATTGPPETSLPGAGM